ncbi:hypothetical protein [Actinomadura fibrosa]|uniref:DUF4333 domain-containing protein n=1 Tax=Actinomadura fibrosa TaxID=111802 RepID=A0ABW2XZS5_9ACTN|nr:hypothetical protein [Actinomadura fibrosa]
MEINRRRALTIGSAAFLVLALAAGGAIAYLVLSGDDGLRYRSQAALRAALPVRAAAELSSRGLTLQSPLDCEDLPGWTKLKMRASCTGMTTDKRDVQVIGTAELETDRSFYTILVGGHPIVENAPCLGGDCRKGDG